MKIDKMIIKAKITVNLLFFLTQKQNVNQFPETENHPCIAGYPPGSLSLLCGMLFCIITLNEEVPGAMSFLMNGSVWILQNFLEEEFG